MKLWLISQTVNRNYDTYDSAVVAAETEAEARATHPSGYARWDANAWCKPDDVISRCIGKAADDIAPGVILASFNAG